MSPSDRVVFRLPGILAVARLTGAHNLGSRVFEISMSAFAWALSTWLLLCCWGAVRPPADRAMRDFGRLSCRMH